MVTKFDQVASDTVIEKTVTNLRENNFNPLVVDTEEEAKEKVLSLVPKGAEVMTMSSVTIDSLGLSHIFNKSGEYEGIKPKLLAMNRETQAREMQKLGAAPDYTVGSVHAVTQDGKVIVASNTGSQLPAYAYGSNHVIWVVGAQKIVENFDEGMKRIYDYILPIESERLAKQYNTPGLKSNVSKLLIFNKEFNPERITLILVKKQLGF